MTHPLITEQLASAHLADLHAEAARARLIRTLRPGRFGVLRRRARGAPPAPVVHLERSRLVTGDVDPAVQSQVA